MKKHALVIALLGSITLTSGCSTVNNTDVGTIGGGVIGGLLGSQFGGGTGKVAAAVGGAMLGAFLGGRIGAMMDKQDRMEVQHALETAKTGSAVKWTNPDSGNHYIVKPTKTYYHENQPCREYVTVAYIDGKKESVHGRACRKPNGQWQAMN